MAAGNRAVPRARPQVPASSTPETVRLAVRDQVRTVQLPPSVAALSRLRAAVLR